MNDALAAELKINSDLVSIVEALKNDFPNLDVQITRMLCLLKSTGSSWNCNCKCVCFIISCFIYNLRSKQIKYKHQGYFRLYVIRKKK